MKRCCVFYSNDDLHVHDDSSRHGNRISRTLAVVYYSLFCAAVNYSCISLYEAVFIPGKKREKKKGKNCLCRKGVLQNCGSARNLVVIIFYLIRFPRKMRFAPDFRWQLFIDWSIKVIPNSYFR